MSPEEFADRHPRLFHVTRPQAIPSIEKHGLLTTSALLDLFAVSGAQRQAIEEKRRPRNVTIRHDLHGEAVVTDNAPLSERALQKCLDDDLTPAHWLRILNGRTFFWPDRINLAKHLQASRRKSEVRTVLVLDTLRLAKAHHERIELAAINTGSTIRRPAHRGLLTFSPAHLYTYGEWQRLRGMHDRLKEVSIVGSVPDIGNYLIETFEVPPV